MACATGDSTCEKLFDWTGNQTLADAGAWVLNKPLQILLVAAIAFGVNLVVRRLTHRLTNTIGLAVAQDQAETPTEALRAKRRARSLEALIKSVSTFCIYGVALVVILTVLGINVVPILASAGIAGVAVGFGAKSLIEDLIAGLFILVEDQFSVGDRIQIDIVNGTVEQVSLRSTVLRDSDGTLWHVPNSRISYIANESQKWSRARVDIGVAYGSDVKASMDCLLSAAKSLAAEEAWEPHVLSEPEVLGVQELGADSINIRVITRVIARHRRQYERELRRTLTEALEAASIAMPNRQLDVWVRSND